MATTTISKYFSKSKIDVFPISVNRTSHPDSRVFTEQHILSLTRGIADCDSYVISETVDFDVPFEFCVHGYYIKVNDLESELKKFSFNNKDNPLLNVYACIWIDTSASDCPHLWGFDEDDVGESEGGFTGVTFVQCDSEQQLISSLTENSIPEVIKESYELHYLHILSYVVNNDGQDSNPGSNQGGGTEKHFVIPNNSRHRFKVVDGGIV